MRSRLLAVTCLACLIRAGGAERTQGLRAARDMGPGTNLLTDSGGVQADVHAAAPNPLHVFAMLLAFNSPPSRCNYRAPSNRFGLHSLLLKKLSPRGADAHLQVLQHRACVSMQSDTAADDKIDLSSPPDWRAAIASMVSGTLPSVRESELSDTSRIILHCSDIEKSLDFWSLFHFVPARIFTTSFQKAAWLTAPWTSIIIDLIELPKETLSSAPAAGEFHLGLGSMVFDVTPIGDSLVSTLEALQNTSESRFGRKLGVLVEPTQQMAGDLVGTLAVIRTPDGGRLELYRRSKRLTHEMKSAWAPEPAEPAVE